MRVPVAVDDLVAPSTVGERHTVIDRGTSVAAVHTALPPHRYAQSDLTELIADLCLEPGADRALLRRLHTSAGVRTRHLALPIEQYAGLGDFGQANAAWMTVGLALAEEALSGALDAAGLTAADIDLLVCTSITGVAAPSLDARLAVRMGMRADVKRVPVFGLGCVGGAAGLGRLHDYLLGHPDDTAVLLSVELCSLTLQRDGSLANLVAGALFGDGAAAVVARGGDAGRRGAGWPMVAATRGHLYPDTEHLLGWRIGASGFRVVVDAGIPDVVRTHLGGDLRNFLATHGLVPDDIGTWVCHPGGPKVLAAVGDALELPDGALDSSWRSLAGVGNLSSASVLRVLEDVATRCRPDPGTWGVLLAMGPGFCAEFVLLRW
ncbi:type III polyketide synthase [Streptomyces xantholiticus]|uniref:3-oxoacyl-[acyl-carrier-protein] synthase III C-terminal domain-containing protein n=1 Tax=Streptomyces xantholiticus TaxID=68285 RepID=A0ABV1UXB7_9ACTN